MVKLRDGRKILGGKGLRRKSGSWATALQKRGAAYPSRKALRVKSRPCVFGAKKRRYGLAGTKWPRRFCCQQDSLDSLQKGFSFPHPTGVRFPAAMPQLTYN